MTYMYTSSTHPPPGPQTCGGSEHLMVIGWIQPGHKHVHQHIFSSFVFNESIPRTTGVYHIYSKFRELKLKTSLNNCKCIRDNPGYFSLKLAYCMIHHRALTLSRFATSLCTCTSLYLCAQFTVQKK